jgi:hypothetical protein
VVIVTDGAENASSELTRDAVFRMIENRSEQGWAFVFLGANQDAYAEGGGIGVARGSAAGWDASADGAQDMWPPRLPFGVEVP